MGVLYNKSVIITGMTCQNCVSKVKKALESENSIRAAEVKLAPESSLITSLFDLSLDELRSIISKVGNYDVSPIMDNTDFFTKVKEKIKTYKPLLLILLFVTVISSVVEYSNDAFDSMRWMRHMMAGFFVMLSFFKFLDWSGFVAAFRQYDIIAKPVSVYAWFYPILELFLGIWFILWIQPRILLMTVLVVLIVGTIGVIQANLNKTKIQCACVGTLFNLPMSEVTIIENTVMILMTITMFLQV